MPNPDVAWNQAGSPEDGRWRRFTASLPMRTALLAVAAVWLLGAVWSFTEQSAFAGNKGFSYPHLLPLVIDGFAVAMAGVAWAASLDARPAVAARLATVIAVAASSASNGAWAYLRTNHDLTAVVLGVAVPIAANLAFEVLLAEMRRQVQRRRGLPPPVAIPYPRLIRLALAPFRTFVEWRELVLDLTQMDLAVARKPEVVADPEPDASPAVPDRTRTAPPPTERVRYEPGGREPVGLERVRRELAQYSEISRQEPVWQEPAGSPSASYESTAFESVGHGSDGHQAHGHEPARREPVRHEPVSRDPAEQFTRKAPATPPINTQNGHPPAPRRRDLEAVPAAAPARLSAAQPPPPTNTRRGVDPRVELLAAHLANTEDAGEFTGEMVGPLLNIDVAPRTGRRLLGMARELVSERARSETDPRDDELSAAIGSG